MVVFAGQGDARRSMALLWRSATETPRIAPGPKPALSVELIIGAAVDVADAAGMAGLSMRAVGERLGRTAMALYTYVPNKSELLDLMYDHVLGEMPAEYTQDGWRDAITAWVDDALELYLRHPWVLQVSQARPVLGPHEYAMLETVLRVLNRTGLESTVVRGAVSSLFHLVRGAAQTIAESRRAEAETGVSDEEWWYGRSSLLSEFAPDFLERFPSVFAVESGKPPQDADSTAPYLEQQARRAFATGLNILLDGVAARIS